jgi:hypothetical protein
VGRTAASQVRLQYISSSGEEIVTTLAEAKAEEIVGGQPVRGFPSYAGMKHYPGWLWTATMKDHVGYESLLERDCLLLADMDQEVVAIASQPFGLTGRTGDTLHRHVPDYLLRRRDGTTVVIDVKPAAFLDEPRVAASLGWTSQVISEVGWRYEVWSGSDPIRLENVRFVAQGRRLNLIDQEALEALAATGAEGMNLDEALSAAARQFSAERAYLRSALLALLWFQVWRVDLDRPLSGRTQIEQVAGSRP